MAKARASAVGLEMERGRTDAKPLRLWTYNRATWRYVRSLPTPRRPTRTTDAIRESTGASEPVRLNRAARMFRGHRWAVRHGLSLRPIFLDIIGQVAMPSGAPGQPE
jgi:hypothetical protein